MIGRLDLHCGVSDVMRVAQEIPCSIEDSVGLGSRLHLQVDAHGIHSRGDCPDVEIMSLDDTGKFGEILGNTININVRRSRLDQHTECFAAQAVRTRKDE